MIIVLPNKPRCSGGKSCCATNSLLAWTCDHPLLSFSQFTVYTYLTDLTFLPMLYRWTHASILSYVKMLSCAKDLIPDIGGQGLNNLELHKY